MNIRKLVASAAIATLVGGGLALATALPANAIEECVPAEAYTEVIPDIEHEAVLGDAPVITPAVEASTQWWEFSPNEKGPFDGTPTFPEDANGKWVGPKTEGGPGQDQSGVYQQGEGNGSWFYRVNVEAKPAVYGERPVVTEAYTEVVADIEHPAVTCDPEPVVVDPVVCVGAGDWYTEGDDIAPVETEAGLVFAGGSGKAVGIRVPVTGNLQGWTSASFNATNVDGQFFFRIVIDASADGGPAYKSLSFPGVSTIDQSSVSYQYGESIAATAIRFPNAQITSVGFQTNSGAPADFSSTLSSFTSDCATVDFTFTEEPPTEEPPVEEPPVVVPPVVEPPVVVEPTAEPTPVAVAASADTLAQTGGNDGLLASLVAGILLLGGAALFAANHVLKSRRQ